MHLANCRQLHYFDLSGLFSAVGTDKKLEAFEKAFSLEKTILCSITCTNKYFYKLYVRYCGIWQYLTTTKIMLSRILTLLLHK